MLFNSIDFAVFLPIVFFLYWFVFKKNLKWQNFLIIIASYIFYGWWDWKFLWLILFSTIVDYFVGLFLFKTEYQPKRKLILWISIICNLGLLGAFKYYDFFLENFKSAFSVFGYGLNINSLNIILPVGISFYTFQSLSYSLDIYKKRIEPTRSFISFAAFVSFFPQLVAGPIERAKSFLPQFTQSRIFNYQQAVDGLRQILWGLFKKMVIADNCAVFVNYIFYNSSDLTGSTLLFGAILFLVQIYCDFSGYSDIAIGTGRLFGFKLMQNFAFPLFSRDIPEFWRRWHISLTTWFRDYLYMPIKRRWRGKFANVVNLFILFILTGLWHGANWTFVIWGALNAVYFLPYVIFPRMRTAGGVIAENSIFPSFKELGKVGFTLILLLIGIIFFRSQDLSHAISFLNGIFSESLFTIPYYRGIGTAITLLILLVIFVLIEWIGRRHQYGIENIYKIKNGFLRKAIYCFLILIIGIFTYTGRVDFIYFQF